MRKLNLSSEIARCLLEARPEPEPRTPEQLEYDKRVDWLHYIRVRKLAEHNNRMRRPGFEKLNRDRAKALEERYPDFRAAFDKLEENQ